MKTHTPIRVHPSTLIRAALGVIALALLVGIFAHAFAGGFSRYVADDFCTAGKLNQVGFWKAQVFWYQQWTGRFAYTFLVTFLEMLGPQIVPYLPGLSLLWLTVVSIIFVHSLFERLNIRAPLILPVFLAVMVIFILLFTTPNIGQNLYWMTGSATYLVPVVVLMALLSVLLNNSHTLPEQPAWRKIAVGALVLLLAWANTGFSEGISVAQFIFLLLINLYYRFWHPERKINRLWLIALAGSVVGIVMLVAAPGNVIRTRAFESPENPFILIVNTLRYSLIYTAVWLLKHLYILFPTGTVLILLTSLVRQYLCIPEAEIIAEAKSRKTVSVVSMGLVFLFVMTFLPSVWVTSSGPEDRAKFFSTLLLSMLFVYACVLAGIRLRDAITIHDNHQRFVTNLLLVCLVFFLAAVPFQETRRVIRSGSNWARFAENWDERDAVIREQMRAGKVQIQISEIDPNPFGLEELSAEPSHWLNVCFADYYGVENIRVK